MSFKSNELQSEIKDGKYIWTTILKTNDFKTYRDYIHNDQKGDYLLIDSLSISPVEKIHKGETKFIVDLVEWKDGKVANSHNLAKIDADKTNPHKYYNVSAQRVDLVDSKRYISVCINGKDVGPRFIVSLK